MQRRIKSCIGTYGDYGITDYTPMPVNIDSGCLAYGNISSIGYEGLVVTKHLIPEGTVLGDKWIYFLEIIGKIDEE